MPYARLRATLGDSFPTTPPQEDDSDPDPDADTKLPIRKLIDIYRRRGYWNPTEPSLMPKLTDAAAMAKAIGRNDGAFVRAYIHFRRRFDNGALGINVPPKPRKGHPEDNAAIIDYWALVAKHDDGLIRLVGNELVPTRTSDSEVND